MLVVQTRLVHLLQQPSLNTPGRGTCSADTLTYRTLYDALPLSISTYHPARSRQIAVLPWATTRRHATATDTPLNKVRCSLSIVVLLLLLELHSQLPRLLASALRTLHHWHSILATLPRHTARGRWDREAFGSASWCTAVACARSPAVACARSPARDNPPATPQSSLFLEQGTPANVVTVADPCS